MLRGAGRGAPGGERPAGRRRGGVPPRRGGARRPAAADPGRRDRPALGLDRLAVPRLQLAAAVPARLARRLVLLPRAAAAAPALRRGGRTAWASTSSATPRRRCRRTHLRAPARRGRDPRGAAASSSRCRPRSRRSARSSRSSTRPTSSRSTRRRWRARSSASSTPSRPRTSRSSGTRATSSRCSTARSPSGSATCAPASSSGCCGSARSCRPRSSSATTSATATRSTGTSPSRRTPRTSSRSRNALGDGLERPLNWIHMPVPERRDDDGWFAPMRDLRLRAGDRALPRPPAPVRPRRGRAAPHRRRAPPRARASASATECGWGRGTAEAVMGLLELHRGVSAPLVEPAAR